MATRAKILRQTRKVSRLEKTQRNKELLAYHQAGSGLFVFRNRSSVGELTLPKPDADGNKVVPPRGEFKGDSYFKQLLTTNEVSLVRTIEPETKPEPSPEPETSTKEQVMTEHTQNEKLILDQPDKVTTEGTVEHVVVDPEAQTLNEDENTENTENKDVLLNEDPLDGVDILSD